MKPQKVGFHALVERPQTQTVGYYQGEDGRGYYVFASTNEQRTVIDADVYDDALAMARKNPDPELRSPMR